MTLPTCLDCSSKVKTKKAIRCLACFVKYNRGANCWQYKGKEKPKCMDCGNQTRQHASKRCRECYEKTMIGETSPRWKGGITVRKDGRVISTKNDRLNYRLVVEKIIGRQLKRREAVHHINENPSDDRPENLFLFRNFSAHQKWHLYIRHRGILGTILKSNLDVYTLK